jgi:hypothetical protein
MTLGATLLRALGIQAAGAVFAVAYTQPLNRTVVRVILAAAGIHAGAAWLYNKRYGRGA